MKKIYLAFTLLMLTVGTAVADVFEMAHKNGFVGCDNAIRTDLKDFLASSSRRVSVDYFNKKNNSTFSITTTFGESGDSIYERTIFEKKAGTCYSFQTVVINFEESCLKYKDSNPAWKFVDEQGDYTWTQNSGGVDALLRTLPHGGCAVTIQLSHIYPVDKS